MNSLNLSSHGQCEKSEEIHDKDGPVNRNIENLRGSTE